MLDKCLNKHLNNKIHSQDNLLLLKEQVAIKQELKTL